MFLCRLLFTCAFLLFYRTMASHAIIPESTDQFETIHEFMDDMSNPVDFRCTKFAHSGFEVNDDDYRRTKYFLEGEEKGLCLAMAPDQKTRIYYPLLTALDPMMPFYIHTIYNGLAVVAKTRELYSRNDPIHRRKYYCFNTRLIASTFLEYFERFDSDDETCWKLKEITVECYTFRQTRHYWAQSVYEKLCLDEDGCFNIMEYYGDDVPYCVKYIATEQLKNASFGTWHHSFINYCKLTDLIPQSKYANYDRLIVRESGKTEEQMQLMCEYFRFQLLTEEGIEGEISAVKTGKEDRSTCAISYWNLLYIALIITSYLW